MNADVYVHVIVDGFPVSIASCCARDGAPVSAPVSWNELEDLESGARYTVRDAAELLDRASSRALQGWGEASQVLPDL